MPNTEQGSQTPGFIVNTDFSMAGWRQLPNTCLFTPLRGFGGFILYFS